MEWCLRPLRADDLDTLVEIDSDPEVMRYLSGGAATPRWAYEEFMLERMLAYGRQASGLGIFMIEDGAQALGWALLRPDFWSPDWLEIGYRLKRAAWGRGVASWAAATLRDRAFALGATTICARAHPDNAASRRVMEKIGLRYVGPFEFPLTRFAEGRFVYPASPGVLYRADRP